MISPPGDPDLELATVQSEIWELERLLAITPEVVSSEVTEHRRRQLDALLARREALRPPLEVDDEPLAHPGLWEPLALYPAGEKPPADAPPTTAPPRSGLERDAREALTRLGALYLTKRGADPAKTLKGVLRAPFAALIRDVAIAVGRDFALYQVVEEAGLKVSKWHLDDPVPLVSEGSNDRIPDAVDGLTATQLQVLRTYFFANDTGDKTASVSAIASAATAFGPAMTEAQVMEAMLPLTQAGACRYPLIDLAGRQLRLTAFGNDAVVKSSSTKTVKTRLPLLLVLGHNGSPLCPPHHLGEVVELLCEELKGGVSQALKADPTYGGTLIDTGHLIEMPPEIDVIVSRRTFNARIEIRNLPPHTSAAAVTSFVAGRFATGVDGSGYVQEGPNGLVTIFVDHVAFVTDLLRRLRSAGVTHRFERIALTGIENGKVWPLTADGVARRFIEASLPRLRMEATDRVLQLQHELHLAEGLIVGSHLHSLVDQIAAAADDADDAVWGLTHFREFELLQTRPSFRWLKLDAADIAAKCAELIADVPEVRGTTARFSVDQAKLLVKEKRLARQRDSARAKWLAIRREISQLKAGLSDDQLKSQLASQLRAIATAHHDERRSRAVGFTPPKWRLGD